MNIWENAVQYIRRMYVYVCECVCNDFWLNTISEHSFNLMSLYLSTHNIPSATKETKSVFCQVTWATKHSIVHCRHTELLKIAVTSLQNCISSAYDRSSFIFDQACYGLLFIVQLCRWIVNVVPEFSYRLQSG